jgi:hypothetical protein
LVSVTIVIVKGLPCRSFTELNIAEVTLPLRLEEGIWGLETKPTKICPQPDNNSNTNRVKSAGALRGIVCLFGPTIKMHLKALLRCQCIGAPVNNASQMLPA